MKRALTAGLVLLISMTAAIALEYQPMSLDDLRLDRAKLMGRKVNVTGYYQAVGDTAMLSNGMGDMSPIFVVTRDLPRDQRKQLLECPPGDCHIMVWGRVGHNFLGYALDAQRVQVLH